MKRMTFMIFTIMAFLLFPASLLADAQKEEWFGEWEMNHDGFAGVLNVTDTKVDCAGPLWCDMAISYVDNNGVRQAGRIEKIDSAGQHMVFYLNFPGNSQKYDAYIFSWDKQRLAGTTYWGGRTFGFYATRKEKNISGSEGLAMIRDAASTGDLLAFEEVINQVVARPGFWGSFWQRVQIHLAQCNNYNGIIRNARGILDSTASSPKEKAWAQGKIDEAIRGKQQSGCSSGNIS